MNRVTWQIFGLVTAGISILAFMYGDTDDATFFILLAIFCNQVGRD